MKRILLALTLTLPLAVVPLTGCVHNAQAGTPATAPVPSYSKAANIMLDFAKDVKTAQTTEINLYHGGAIDKPTHLTIQTTFKQISVYGKQIDALIAAQASASTITAKVNAALASTNAIIAATSKLDPGTAQQVAVGVQAIQFILNSVTAALPTH